MRKPRNYDAQLKALDDKAKDLRIRWQRQLGELVIKTGADGLDVEILAGALLAAVESKDSAQREGWRQRGAAFFRRGARDDAGGADRSADRGAAQAGAAVPSGSEPGKA